jgi:hypothetical protein
MAKEQTKTRVTKKQVIAHRTRAVKDTSPTWEGCETWDGDKFHKHFRSAMDYYRLESDIKTFKPVIVKWLESQSASKEHIALIKKVKDNRISGTMGAVASCLLRGMTPQRPDFNGGRDTAAWLRNAIVEVMAAGKNDTDDEEKKEEKPAVPQISIQERVRDAAMNMTEELENAIEAFQEDPDSFDPKAFKVVNLLRSVEAKAAHARLIRGFYERNLKELEEASQPKCDEQLKEAYGHLSKANMKKIILFYQEIMSACDMLAQEAKVNRAPRAKKPTDKAKVVAKLKYLKQHEPLKLVSVNPVDIIGSKELWVYNTKSRKLGRYVASEYAELGVKGTSITGFDENASICKTIRKPEDKLKEFKAAGKVALRKFLDDINATDTKMNGRINEEIILLKVA